MKKNGFVFMETIIVVAVLSVTLILLYSSYSYIIKKTKERNNYDTTETIYKTHLVNDVLNGLKPESSSETGIVYFAKNHLSSSNKPTDEEIKSGIVCNKIKNSYVCDISSDNYHGELETVKSVFQVEKLYFLNPFDIYLSDDRTDWLYNFDATTIDYINKLGDTNNQDLLVIKYSKKGMYDNGRILHSSMEVY